MKEQAKQATALTSAISPTSALTPTPTPSVAGERGIEKRRPGLGILIGTIAVFCGYLGISEAADQPAPALKPPPPAKSKKPGSTTPTPAPGKATPGQTAKATPAATPTPKPKPTPRPTPRKENPPEKPIAPGIKNRVNTYADGYELRARIKLAARALDHWTMAVEEYGTVTMSAPLLAPPGANFKFDLALTAKELYDNARTDVAGVAKAGLVIASQGGLGIAVQGDPTVAAAFENKKAAFAIEQQRYLDELNRAQLKNDLVDRGAEHLYNVRLEQATKEPDPVKRAQMVKEANDEFSASLTGGTPGEVPLFPTAATDDKNAPAAHTSIAPDPSTLAASVAAIQDAQTKLDDLTGPVKFPDRFAITEASGNSAVMSILNFLAKPEEIMKFADKKVLFGVVTVGVNPGWRTKKDFAAEVTTQTGYQYVKARSEIVKKLADLDRLPLAVRTDLLINHGLKDLIDKEIATKKKADADAKKAGEKKVADAKVEKQKQKRLQARQEAEKEAALRRGMFNAVVENLRHDADAIAAWTDADAAIFTPDAKAGEDPAVRQGVVQKGKQQLDAARQNASNLLQELRTIQASPSTTDFDKFAVLNLADAIIRQPRAPGRNETDAYKLLDGLKGDRAAFDVAANPVKAQIAFNNAANAVYASAVKIAAFDEDAEPLLTKKIDEVTTAATALRDEVAPEGDMDVAEALTEGNKLVQATAAVADERVPADLKDEEQLLRSLPERLDRLRDTSQTLDEALKVAKEQTHAVFAALNIVPGSPGAINMMGTGGPLGGGTSRAGTGGGGGGGGGGGVGEGGGGGDIAGLGGLGAIPFDPVRPFRPDDSRLHHAAPIVAGVSPLMETQSLDLTDTYRRQDALALSLSATLRRAGLVGQANAFEKFARDQKKNVRTLSPAPVVNTFSASGGLFGFNVGPRLKALEDPASRKGGSANVLDQQSFPALLIFGMDTADFTPIVIKDWDDKYYVFEPEMVLTQTSRWNPLDRKLYSTSKNDWWKLWGAHAPRYSERDRARQALDITDNFYDLTEWLDKQDSFLAYCDANPGYTASSTRLTRMRDGKGVVTYREEREDGAPREKEVDQYREIIRTLQQRRKTLEFMVTGSVSSQYLPTDFIVPPDKTPAAPAAAAPPQIVSVTPGEIPVKEDGAPFAGVERLPSNPVLPLVDLSQPQFAVVGTGLKGIAKENVHVIPEAAGEVISVGALAGNSGVLVRVKLATPALAFVFKIDVPDPKQTDPKKEVPFAMSPPVNMIRTKTASVMKDIFRTTTEKSTVGSTTTRRVSVAADEMLTIPGLDAAVEMTREKTPAQLTVPLDRAGVRITVPPNCVPPPCTPAPRTTVAPTPVSPTPIPVAPATPVTK